MQSEANKTHESQLFRSATDAGQAIRRKEISSRELTEMLLAQIEAVNPTLNAVVGDGAREMRLERLLTR